MKTISETIYYSITVNKKKNRIYLTLNGYWKRLEDVSRYLDDIAMAVREVTPGFCILSDLRMLKTPPTSLSELHRMAQEAPVKAGLGRTAEIVPEEGSSELEKALEEYSRQSSMKKRVFRTRAEGELWLNGSG